MRIKHLILLMSAWWAPCLYSYLTPHFYRANYFFGEPRLEKPWLGSWEINFDGGSTRTARNSDHKKVPLLDIYGTYNMRILGNGVPNKNPANPEDAILNALALVPARGTFGYLSFAGEFNAIEGSLTVTQNFARGIFLEFNIPWSSLQISNITYTDLSPTDSTYPNVNTSQWQAFLANFDAILARYDLNKSDVHTTGLDDVSFLLGWTQNYQDTEVLDFVDTTIKMGILAPTGRDKKPDFVFSLDHGYEGHIGFPLSFDIALGAYEWLTLGVHFEGILFLNKTKNVHLKTDANQSGMIFLAQGEADIRRQANWEVGTYAKADHVYKGISLIFAYSFASQNKQTLTPCNEELFPKTIVNTNIMRNGFNMHTLNFIGEYDFTKEYSKYGPRISLFYNKQVGGKRTFNTSIFGGTFGLEVDWNL